VIRRDREHAEREAFDRLKAELAQTYYLIHVNNSVIPKILEQAGILFGALPQTPPGEMISPGPPAI
jgi:hypothetical protein